MNSCMLNNGLSHCVEEFDRLVEILHEGFVPNYHIEDLSLDEHNSLFLGIPMVSFSDLSTEQLISHMNVYGKYCLSLKKEWGVKNQEIKPIEYRDNGFPCEVIQNDSIFCLLSHVKKKTSLWLENEDYDNSAESEWLYVVPHNKVPWMLSKEEYDDWRGNTKEKRPRPNEALQRETLLFSAEDIGSIVIPTESDRQNLMKELPLIYSFGGQLHSLRTSEIEYLSSIIHVISSN